LGQLILVSALKLCAEVHWYCPWQACLSPGLPPACEVVGNHHSPPETERHRSRLAPLEVLHHVCYSVLLCPSFRLCISPSHVNTSSHDLALVLCPGMSCLVCARSQLLCVRQVGRFPSVHSHQHLVISAHAQWFVIQGSPMHSCRV
jgi:hypothetical protein